MASLGETVAALAASRWTPHVSDERIGGLKEVALAGHNPGALRMLVHAPEARAAKAPLVVVLHGCTQTAAGYAGGAGWVELADRYGFVLVCPEQSRANNPNLCFNWFNPDDIARGAGEAGSIHAMVRQAVGAYDLDARRVFVTGLSAGGAMANVMLAAYPESFAAGAIVAGLPYGVASNVQEALGAMRHARRLPAHGPGDAARRASSHLGPWPRVSIWQGNEDATVVAGVAEDVARQWRDLHGVDAVAADVKTSAGRRDTVWRNRRGEAVVTLHQLAGIGHGTPLGCSLADGCGTAGPYLLEVGVSSTLEIARSWGLIEAGRTLGPSRRSASPADPRRARELHPTASVLHPPRVAAPRVVAEVGGVITDALRSAGLLK